MGSGPSARHDQAQWLGTDIALAARGRKKEALGCHALLLQVRADSAWYKALFGFTGWTSKEICWRCKANCGDLPWTDTSTAAAWRTSPDRARDQCLVLFTWVFGELICTDVLHSMDLGTTQDASGNLFFRSGRRPGGTQVVVQFSVCVSALVCLCLCSCSSVLRVYVQLCLLSLAGPGFFRAQSRSGRIAELWNRIKLHCMTFHTQSRLQSLTWEMSRVDQKPPKLRAKGAETRHLCLAVSNWQWTSTLRAAVRLVHDHVCGAVRLCRVRQVLSPVFCNLYKALLKEAFDDKLWKMKPKMHMVQVMCQVQSELLGNPREFWSFMGVVSSMAHSRSGSATASTLCVGHTSGALALMIRCKGTTGQKK